jgi:hypothetical protein
MNSPSIPMLILIVFSVGSFVFAVRKLVRGSLSSAEFRKHFSTAWWSTGMFGAGTVWLVLSVPGLKPNAVMLAMTIGGFALATFMLTAFPATWLAWRLYKRSRANPDFAEDASDNSMPASPEEDPNEEPVESWRDVIRAERKRRS